MRSFRALAVAGAATAILALTAGTAQAGPLDGLLGGATGAAGGLGGSTLNGSGDNSAPNGSLLPSLPQVEVPPVPTVNQNGIPTLPTDGLDPDGPADSTPVTFNLGGQGITAKITVTGRKVVGTATGLTPGRRYISLYYGIMSAQQGGQTLSCADARTAAFPQKWGISPEWVVAADGTGTLNATAPRDRADGVSTMSIRRVPPTALSDPYVGFNPVQYPVVACGKVPPVS